MSTPGGFTGMPKIKKPVRLPLKVKLSMAAKIRSFIGKGAFGRPKSDRVKQPNFTKNL